MTDRFMAAITAGDAAFKGGDHSTARAELEKAVAIRASHPPLLRLYADCCRQTGDAKGEWAALRRLVVLAPTDQAARSRCEELSAALGHAPDPWPQPVGDEPDQAAPRPGLLQRLLGRKAGRPATDPRAQLVDAIARYDFRTATAMIEPLLAARPQDAELQAAAARIALAQGRTEDALAHAEQAIDLGAQDAETAALRIRAAAAGDRFDLAKQLLDGLAPDLRAAVPVKLAEAALCFETDRADEALELLDEAEAGGERPALAAELRARVLAGRGDFDAARPVFTEWARRAPTSGGPFVAASENRLFDRESPLYALATELVRNPRAGAGSRAAVHFALARACKAAGNHDEEFAHVERANILVDAFYDPWTEAEQARSVMAAFDGPLPVPGEGDERGQGMIFVCGLPRSGSTLVAQILAAHPDVVSIGESQIFPRLLARATAAGYPDDPDALGEEVLRDLGQAYLDDLPPAAGGAQFVVDKELSKYQHLGPLRRMLPGARIVHTRRNPMDVCHSMYCQNFTGWPATFRLETLAHFHHLHDRLMAHWNALMPGDIHLVQYEDMVTDTENQIRQLLDWAGVPFHSDCLNFQGAETVVRTASSFQVRQGIYGSSVDAWKRHEAQMAPLLRALETPPFT